MTGLTQEQMDWLYERVAAVVTWEEPAGRPRVLPLYTALVMVVFALRHNLPTDVCGELFDCSTSTVWRCQEELEPLVEQVLEPLAAEVVASATSQAVLVDGLVAPVGQREGTEGLYSGKKHVNGQNVQVVADLAGCLVDVGDPCPGSRYDSRAFVDSGISARWAGHLAEDGPGMLGDKGYQGTGMITPYKKPRGGELTDVQKACNTSLNRLRAAVERAVAHLKNWKVLKTGYRRALTDFPRILRTVTKLEIYRCRG